MRLNQEGGADRAGNGEWIVDTCRSLTVETLVCSLSQMESHRRVWEEWCDWVSILKRSLWLPY